MKFRLLYGAHVQANPDGFDSMSLKRLREIAKERSVEDHADNTKERLVQALRGRDEDGEPMPGEIVYQATANYRPTFEENNKHAIAALLQDRGKYQCLEGELDADLVLGPITDEEVQRRGFASNRRVAGSTQMDPQSATVNELDSHPQLQPATEGGVPNVSRDLNARLVTMTTRQLQDYAAAEEIQLTDAQGEPLRSKPQMIKAIHDAMALQKA